MRRAGKSLACGHPMCDPGSAECVARDVAAGRLAEVLGDRPLYVGEQSPTYVEGKLIPVELFDQLVADAQAELDHAIGSANRAAPDSSTSTVVANWRRTRPGFARLLDLTDQT